MPGLLPRRPKLDRGRKGRFDGRFVDQRDVEGVHAVFCCERKFLRGRPVQFVIAVDGLGHDGFVVKKKDRLYSRLLDLHPPTPDPGLLPLSLHDLQVKLPPSAGQDEHDLDGALSRCLLGSDLDL